MSTPASDAVRLPEQFGRYRIVRPLGKGGMGAVYLARDTRLDRDVALKVCTLADSPKALDRFRREAKAAAALRHPNLCRIYDYDVHDDIAFITMEFVDGLSLDRWLAQNPLDVRGVAKLVYKIALAMQVAHDGGVIHRDLKPGNIAIDKKGEPVVIDFGLARMVDARSQKTQQGAVFGTLSYMAPEQARGDSAAICPATDVYALGVILYEMLTGELPFIGPPEMVLAQILVAKPKAPRKYNPDVPEVLETICLKTLAKKPDERFPTMKAFADAMARGMRGLPASSGKAKTVPPPTSGKATTVPPPTPAKVTEIVRSRQPTLPPPLIPTIPHPTQRGPWLAIGLSLVLVAVLAVVVVVFLWIWPLLNRRSSPTEPVAPAARAKYDEAVAEGRRALAEGSFAFALKQFSAAVKLRDGQPGLVDSDERRRLNQLYWQSDLLANQLDRPLVELLREASKHADEKAWLAQFELQYRGKTVLFDDVVLLDREGKRGLRNGKELRWKEEGRQVEVRARVQIDDLKLLEQLPVEARQRWLFGARLRSFVAQEKDWVIQFEPDSGVLLTDADAVLAWKPALRDDPQLPDVLERQGKRSRQLLVPEP